MMVHTKVTPWQLDQALGFAAPEEVRRELADALAKASEQAEQHQPLTLRLSLTAMMLCSTVKAFEQVQGHKIAAFS